MKCVILRFLGLGGVLALSSLRADSTNVTGGKPCPSVPALQIVSDPKGEYLVSSATVISPDARVVCGVARKEGSDGRVAFRWVRDEGLILLGDLAGGKVDSAPSGISTDGSFVVGTSSSAKGREAFGWTAGSGMIGLGDFEGGEFKSSATGVSGDGRIIVGSGVAEGNGSSRRHGDAFVWTREDRMQSLADLGDFDDTSWIGDISTDGTTFVGKGSNAKLRSEAFRVHRGKLHGLGCLLDGTDFYSEAIAVSGDGGIVVGNSGHSNRQREVFLWTEARGIQGLPDFPREGRTHAIDVSDTGRVLGRWFDGGNRDHFVWDEKRGYVFIEERVKRIDPPDKQKGWFDVSSVKGISADGRHVVGYGRHRVNGRIVSDAFLLDLGE